jgi:Alpha/beta hydrolase domain
VFAALDVSGRRFLRFLAVPCACLGVAGCASGGPERRTRLAVPTPTVVGPIRSTWSDFPFIADGFGPEPRVPSGYDEDEYFVSGRANLYEYSATGVRVVASCPASAGRLGCRNLPYTTRMLVKRPIDPRRFSGTVIIEPFNPSSGYDIANVWDRSWPYFVEHGDVFVGWTSRYESIRALERFEPRRYARLAWGENSVVDDGITFDIAAQIGALFKRGGPRSPLHGLKVRHVFEAGFSQDGAFTFTQADVFNAIDRLPSGGPVYDGYVPGGAVGPSDINFGLTAAGSLPLGDPRNRMQPRDSPVIQINTETEEVLLGGPTGLAYRRPDSNARTDRYRLWEVPGASHISNDLGSSPITEERDLAEIDRIPLSRLPPTGCARQQDQSGPWVGVHGVVDPNPYPFGYVADAAFADLTKWLDDGTPPPRAARIQVTDPRAGTTDRDRFGNALGGLRTPFVDVPTATYSPIDVAAHETELSGLCPLIGFSIPLSHAALHALYPSHADYLARVTREANELVHKGFWVASDAATVVRQAAASDVP